MSQCVLYDPPIHLDCLMTLIVFAEKYIIQVSPASIYFYRSQVETFFVPRHNLCSTFPLRRQVPHP